MPYMHFLYGECSGNVNAAVRRYANACVMGQCSDEIVPNKSTSTTLRNNPLTYKHDSAGSFSITGDQLNRVYVRARDYAKLYWSTSPVLFRPDTGYGKRRIFCFLKLHRN
jgi:hypothetical protein